MRLLAPLLTTLALPLLALAAGGDVYGKGVTEATTVKVSELLEKPEAFVGKKVRVSGLVTDVCAKRGCWINLAGDKEFQTMRFKVKDGEMVFPMSAKGKQADVEGTFKKIELTEEQAVGRAKHLAEENGKPFDPKSVVRVVYQIDGTGAVVR